MYSRFTRGGKGGVPPSVVPKAKERYVTMLDRPSDGHAAMMVFHQLNMLHLLKRPRLYSLRRFHTTQVLN